MILSSIENGIGNASVLIENREEVSLSYGYFIYQGILTPDFDIVYDIEIHRSDVITDLGTVQDRRENNMVFYRETSIGKIGMEEEDGYITRLYLPNDSIPPGTGTHEPPVISKAFAQLDLYLNGKLQKFTLPLRPRGTPFMQKVWQKLSEVPYGHVASYKDIAVAIESPKAARAVGQANHCNPIPIFIPCHRIIGANGDLVGYGGGLAIKKKLLGLEGYRGKETRTGEKERI